MKPNEEQPTPSQPTDSFTNQPVENDSPATQPSGSVVSPTTPASTPETTPNTPVGATAAAEPKPPVAPITPPTHGEDTLPSVMSGDSLVVGGNSGATSYVMGASGKPPKAKSKKKLLLLGGVLAAILLLGAGYVFAFYIPNKPENVWKTGLNRTGQAIDTLVQDASKKDKLDKLTASELRGNVTVKNDAIGKISGSFAAQMDKETGNVSLDLSIPQDGADNAELSAKVLLETPPKEQYPDVYFKLAGFSALGLDAWVPGVNNYDGKWISVSSDYLKKNLSDQATPKSEDTVTAADAAEVTRVVTQTTREYVLTADPGKAVLVNKGFKGKETVDGVHAYHYKAAVDKNHAKAYCEALITNVSKTAAFKKLVDEKDRADRVKDAIKSCKDNADDIKSNDTFDLWIDSKYKLITKVRAYEEGSTKNYVDFGQVYKGDDTLHLYSKIHDEDQPADFNMTMQVNFKTMKMNGTFNGTSGEGKTKYTYDSTFSMEASSKKVTIDKPTTSVPLQQVLDELGLSDMFEQTPAATSDDVSTRSF